MTNESHIIAVRLREVEGEIGRFRERIDALEKERAELEVAAKVFARLTGSPVPERTAFETVVRAQAAKALEAHTASIIDLIRSVMEDVGATGVAPKGVTKIIESRWDPSISGAYVSSAMWRMAKNGELEKIEGTSRYRLPQEKEPSDKMPGEASEGSLLETSAKGREAGPGGGT